MDVKIFGYIIVSFFIYGGNDISYELIYGSNNITFLLYIQYFYQIDIISK